MATIVGPDKGSERAAMERFGSGGMALLPWTKQILTVLWEQLRLLVQVIYYTFMSGKSKVNRKTFLFCLCLFAFTPAITVEKLWFNVNVPVFDRWGSLSRQLYDTVLCLLIYCTARRKVNIYIYYRTY